MYLIDKLFIKYFPNSGKLRRLFIAYKDFLFSKASYSQHHEDILILEHLKKYNLKETYYLDAGANHPTRISNTFLLYKNGLKGIVVEPNVELINLHKKIRKRDFHLAIGCSEIPKIEIFNQYVIHVLGNFKNNENSNLNNKLLKSYPVPLFPIDLITESFKFEWISLLSIDVEGMDYLVLKGAENTLKKTLLICIEANEFEEQDLISNFLTRFNFKLLTKLGCNLIFKSESRFFDQYLFN